MKLIINLIIVNAFILLFNIPASIAHTEYNKADYSQDPRTCSDPRSQYPSNPPC